MEDEELHEALGRALHRSRGREKALRSAQLAFAYIALVDGPEKAAEEAYRFADHYAVDAARFPKFPGAA